MGSTLEMIDLHCHILPGLDDGPETMEESVRMCWIAHRDGIRTIVATPHMLDGAYQNSRTTILEGVEALVSELQTQELPIKILPGSDVHLSEATLSLIEKGEAVTIGEGGRYLLIEFPSQAIPHQAERVLFQLLSRGVTPIITHPERNLEIMKRLDRFYEMIRMGCLGQLTAMSLTGAFGTKVRQCAERLLRLRLVHLIASDGHSENGRPPILSQAVKAASKIIGSEEAGKMVTQYPEIILRSQRLDLPDPIPPP